MWMGVARNEDPVWTECGLEECIQCKEVDALELVEGFMIGSLDLDAEDFVDGKL